MYALGHAFGQLLALFTFLTPVILFLLTQQNILKVIRPENRELHPGLVWLQLIPIFNYYWVFVVVTRIADSISKENVAIQDDSILGMPDFDAVKAIGKRPTYGIGMAFCILCAAFPCLFIIVNIFGETAATGAFDAEFGILVGTLILAAMTCWIIYWVKLAANKRKLMYLHA